MIVWLFQAVIWSAHLHPYMRRRTLLASIGGLAATPILAGCLGGSGGTTPTPTPEATPTPTPDVTSTPTPDATPSPDPSDSGDHPVTPTEQTFEVLDRRCGSGEHAATVGFDWEVVAVDGVIGGRDTCDTARLASADLAGDVLTVVVDVVEESHTETAACAQCLTDIEYAFTATFTDEGPTSVRIVHRSADGETTVATADWP